MRRTVFSICLLGLAAAALADEEASKAAVAPLAQALAQARDSSSHGGGGGGGGFSSGGYSSSLSPVHSVGVSSGSYSAPGGGSQGHSGGSQSYSAPSQPTASYNAPSQPTASYDAPTSGYAAPSTSGHSSGGHSSGGHSSGGHSSGGHSSGGHSSGGYSSGGHSSGGSSGGYGGGSASTGNLYYYYYPVQEQHHHSGKYGYPGKYGGGDGKGGLLGVLSAVLVPILVLGGALLLLAVIGTLVTSGTGREIDGRSADPLEAWRAELERLLFQYMAVLQEEDCVPRVFCEMGLEAESYRFVGKELALSLAERFAPEMIQGSMSVLKRASTGEYDSQQCRQLFKCTSRTGGAQQA